MVMRVIEPPEVRTRCVQVLGLSGDTFTEEALAALLRRAAAFRCPCTKRTLVGAVADSLEKLGDDHAADSFRERIENILEALISYGDLVEIENSREDAAGVQLFTAPSSFVHRKSGTVLLFGIASDGVSPLPTELESEVRASKHVRVLSLPTDLDLTTQLTDLGLAEIKQVVWLKTPKKQDPKNYLSDMKDRLEAADPCGEVEGLELIDPERPVDYYRGRWVKPAEKHSGGFVARRPQAYGHPIWCYVLAERGCPVKLLDFPVADDCGRGCDEAWRVQIAIDFLRDDPQKFKRRVGPVENQFVDFFSPVPQWALRRWDLIGKKSATASKCLFTYEFAAREIEEEIDFISKQLWLVESL